MDDEHNERPPSPANQRACMTPNQTDPVWIDNKNALDQLVADFTGADWLAVDTEFVRERTYFPQLCLLQISDGNAHAVIDCIAIDDLSPLQPLLTAPNTLKVFHSGSQDLELLVQTFGAPPTPVFDTQIAAALLGHGEQIGYANLIEQELGVRLDKQHTRTDWSRRPLSAAEISYAADDVRYLGPAWLRLRDQLQQLGREDWLRADFAALSNPARYAVSPQRLWKQVKGIGRLRGSSLTAARKFAEWRDAIARDRNLPRGWVLKDNQLLDIARAMPTTHDGLDRLQGVDGRLVKRHGDVFLEIIAQATAEPAPEVAKPERLSDDQEPLVDLLMAVLRHCAQENRISPAALASRKALEALVRGERDLALLDGWRAAAAGQTVLDVLEGKKNARIEGGRLHVV